MVVIVSIIIILSFIGSEYKIRGIDEAISEIIVEETGKEPVSIIPTISDYVGEGIIFTAIGMIAGFIVGYIWTGIFNKEMKRLII